MELTEIYRCVAALDVHQAKLTVCIIFANKEGKNMEGADILRNKEADEVKKFVAYWKDIQGNVDETLAFDCRFSAYKVLDAGDG